MSVPRLSVATARIRLGNASTSTSGTVPLRSAPGRSGLDPVESSGGPAAARRRGPAARRSACWSLTSWSPDRPAHRDGRAGVDAESASPWSPVGARLAAAGPGARGAAVPGCCPVGHRHRGAARTSGAAELPPPAWLDQLAAVADEAVPPGVEQTLDHLVAFADPGASLVEIWTDLVQLLVLLAALPALEQLVPPPSAWAQHRPQPPGRGWAGAQPRTQPIRTLLAKAEATEFAAEAETFTAKAQDLMTRHAIDEALLRAREARSRSGAYVCTSTTRTREKVSLLNQVARANRCRAVWNKPLGLVTVLGTPVDVDQVEMLFTSLLIQATRAMAEGGTRRAGSFDRSASFRRSFLMAYAVRIGERLTETSTAAAESYGAELVPLLQRQTEAVQEEFDRLFPKTRSARAGRYNAVGWEAGREAADRAHLTAGRLTG